MIVKLWIYGISMIKLWQVEGYDHTFTYVPRVNNVYIVYHIPHVGQYSFLLLDQKRLCPWVHFQRCLAVKQTHNKSMSVHAGSINSFQD